MSTRHDVSGVPPQGGYVAKRCPVRAQWDTIRPCDPLEPSPELLRRLARGLEFEREVVARLAELHPDARLIAGREPAARREAPAEREAATARAMAEGAALIVGGRLPTDLVHRRAGEPDLLVAAAGGGYRPVDIKHHRTAAATATATAAATGVGGVGGGGGVLPARRSPLATPAWEAAADDPGARSRRQRDDLLQLAHYQRMLEAAGFAPAAGRYAGIVGTEQMVTWFDLDAPIWRTPSSGGRSKLRTTMEVYDFEFDFRLDVIAVAAQHQRDPRVALLVVPVRIPECHECPWWSRCGPELRAGAGDVSLLPRVGWREWRIHRDHGVTDRSSLAALHHGTALLVAERVDLRPVIEARGTMPDATPVAGLAARPGDAAKLAAAGIVTLGDARALSERTARYQDQSMRSLPEQIDLARAALGGAPVYRRRGVGRVVVPRGDVEIDIDMESAEPGVYLWGALVTDRSGLGIPAGYRAFADFGPMDGAGEADLFASFWAWLADLHGVVAGRGRQVRAYCFHAAAENSQMRRIGSAAGLRAQVEEFLGSGDWVDLREVFGSQLITGGPTGLKDIAPLAGYSWEVDEPGGGESMVRYDEAAGTGAAADAARGWLLTYNRGDVEASRALREWLDGAASGCPPVGEIGP